MNQPFFVCVFFSFRPSLPRFPSRVYNSFRGFCASLLLFRPPRSCSSPPVPGRWSSTRCDGLAGASGLPAVVAGYLFASPVLSCLPIRSLSPLHPHLYSHPHYLSRSRSHPYPRDPLHTRIPSRPRPSPYSRRRFFPPIPGALFSLRYHINGSAPGLAREAVCTCVCVYLLNCT